MSHEKRSLKKIADVPKVCMSPEHNPPAHVVLEPGVYEHTCPDCGERVEFVVSAQG